MLLYVDRSSVVVLNSLNPLSIFTVFVTFPGVIARHPSYLPFIRAALTPEAVLEYFKHLFEESDQKTCKVYR